MCTSWSSANQISNFKFLTFFRVLFALWSLKYPHPKSQQTPQVSTELEMVVNLSYSSIPLQKISQKGVDRSVGLFFFIIQINSGLFPCNFVRESQQIQINKFGRNALNYLLTSLARAVLGNIGHWWFVFLDLAVLCPHCYEHGPIFPITVLALG